MNENTWAEGYGHGPQRLTAQVKEASETATFCFRCGRVLTELKGPYCAACDVFWQRVYVSVCHESEHGTWVHLYSPLRVEGEGPKVNQADGFAECEVCAEPHLYRWTPKGLTLTTLNGKSKHYELSAVESGS